MKHCINLLTCLERPLLSTHPHCSGETHLSTDRTLPGGQTQASWMSGFKQSRDAFGLEHVTGQPDARGTQIKPSAQLHSIIKIVGISPSSLIKFRLLMKVIDGSATHTFCHTDISLPNINWTIFSSSIIWNVKLNTHCILILSSNWLIRLHLHLYCTNQGASQGKHRHPTQWEICPLRVRMIFSTSRDSSYPVWRDTLWMVHLYLWWPDISAYLLLKSLLWKSSQQLNSCY